MILNQVDRFLGVFLGNKPRLLIWEFIVETGLEFTKQPIVFLLPPEVLELQVCSIPSLSFLSPTLSLPLPPSVPPPNPFLCAEGWTQGHAPVRQVL